MSIIIPNQELDERAVQFPYSWTQYKKIFAIEKASINSIIEMQKEQIKTYAFNNNEALEMLNNEFTGLNKDFSEEIEKQVTSNIEKNLQNLRKKFDDAEKQGMDFNTTLNQLLNSWQQIIGSAINLKNVDYKQLDSIKKSLYKLQTNINLLRNWLQSDESGRTFDQLAQLRIKDSKTEEAKLTIKKSKKYPSLIRQLAGIGSALKGLDLERIATKVLAEKIPDLENFEQTEVVNTGAIRVSIGNKGTINIKEDIALFDMSFDTKIKLTNGKVITLKELVERANKSEQITLTQEGYEELQSAMITALSAKSTQSSNKIQLHGGLTTSKILLEALPQDQMYWTLKHLHQIKMANLSFRGDKDYIENLINYNMSKMLTKIIGLKNDFLVTREGFVSMNEYLTNMLENNKYIHVATGYLDKGMNVQI